ncbi:MAG: fumarate hydratase [Nitrososphaerota archaeon]|nr:fumarate hydratase [Nitrososphaerales archaeon]MDW8045526.1 fumarate hydratase [Nitrososphaerota archaeon]
MKVINVNDIQRAVSKVCMEINYNLREGMEKIIEEALQKEESELGREVLKQMLENVAIAKMEKIPACQDTGVCIAYVQLGQDVRIEGGFLYDAINRGVAEGYVKGYLRKSVVRDPLNRINTGDNTPAVIHVELVPGDELKIILMAKGAGSENMGQVSMLTPADGLEGVKKFVIKTVKEGSINACPPVIVGVGIGGTFDTVGWLAKKALFRGMNVRNKNEFYAKLELELLKEINDLGIGPAGLGGRITALDVRIEYAPCHIAALPVAVNLECNAHRVGEIIL